jgi:hypothetical protein
MKHLRVEEVDDSDARAEEVKKLELVDERLAAEMQLAEDEEQRLREEMAAAKKRAIEKLKAKRTEELEQKKRKPKKVHKLRDIYSNEFKYLDTKNTKYDYDTIETIMRRYRWHMAAKK